MRVQVEHTLTFFLTLKTFLNFVMFHFPSPKNFKHPTIDLTCFCKKDLDTNLIIILPFRSFFIRIFFIVLIGDFAEHEEDR